MTKTLRSTTCITMYIHVPVTQDFIFHLLCVFKEAGILVVILQPNISQRVLLLDCFQPLGPPVGGAAAAEQQHGGSSAGGGGTTRCR